MDKPRVTVFFDELIAEWPSDPARDARVPEAGCSVPRASGTQTMLSIVKELARVGAAV